MNKKLTILIVDDAELNRRILKNIFEDDYRIIEAEDGNKAIKVLKREEKIDVILLDIIMPTLNGFEFLKLIKKHEKFKDIPVIVNTQAGEEKNECMALKLGADDFIAKPYNSEIVKRRVSNIIEKHILKHENMKQKIKDTTERLDTLVDTVPGGIGVFEIGDKIQAVYFNEGLCKILGYSKEEAGDLYSHDVLKSVYPEDIKYILNQIKKMNDKDKVVHSKLRLIRKDGSILWCGITAKRIYMENDKSMCHAVFMDISEEKDIEFRLEKSMKELKFYAERDYLTLMYNRAALYKYTRELISKNKDKKYIIGYWDIDSFKVINELFGEKTGDSILRKITRYLNRINENMGVYGRLESDHFITCLPEEVMKNSMKKIERLISGHNNLGIAEYPVMLHVGLYIVDDPEVSIDIACSRALMALESIKGNYIKRWAYYDEKLKNTIMKEQRLINDTENALKENQFVINLQPIYNIKENRLVSAEALVRWNHPVNGMIPPDLFIPLFERNGFITKLDMYVLEEVCRYLADNEKSGVKNVPVSVNLSRMDFYNKNLCREIENILSRYHIDNSLIKIEITESAYNDNYQNLYEAVSYFRNNGFKVLMDDFGSGYSSLNMIKDIDVDILKIDMKFINNLEGSEKACGILMTIIDMAKILNLEVIAEGVETFSQYKMLKSMGCDCIQGYYFSEPLSKKDFKNLLGNEINMKKFDLMNQNKTTILVVDDQKLNVQVIMESLKEKYRIIKAHDGFEAIDILNKEFANIKLILSDIVMPKMDGIELLEKINSNKLFAKIPVLMITAYGESERISKALELGAVDIINKPFDVEILQKRIENLLKLSENEEMKIEVFTLRKNAAIRQHISELFRSNIVAVCSINILNGDIYEGNIRFMNNMYMYLHNTSQSRINSSGGIYNLFGSVHEDDYNIIRELYYDAIEDKKGYIQAAYRIVWDDGQVRNVVSNCNFKYKDNNIILDIVETEVSEINMI